jgi:AAHS family 4-hydroxybenzoate transporter-like MFS transporter
MSWALGIGRIGSVVGSMIGGVLLGHHWSATGMLLLMAGVLLVSTVGSALLAPLMRHAALASATDDASGHGAAPLAGAAQRAD